jgi:2-hydroxy-3-keto-5-methylthiopentenyl-1-phosphate phosphatase
MKCHVFVDFDGTIATEDTTDLLLERFADPRWRDVEEEWKAGRIGSRECMVRQIALVRASPGELDEFLAGIDIDPAFPRFVRVCQQLGFPLTVLSDGLDYSVNRVLSRAGLALETRANCLTWLGGDRWSLSFPHARGDCAALAGNCKCHCAEEAGPHARVLIGDGRSDFCFAGRADLVLAKGSLLAHCAARDYSHIAFADFREARDLLLRWVEGRAPALMAHAAQ